jgi:uncharacterized protein YfeS
MADIDPFNNQGQAHKKARELMDEGFFWNCADEYAPFGSDEGWEAYYEWRRWRAAYAVENLCSCFNWILDGNIEKFNDSLIKDEVIERDIANPDGALLAEHFDVFTLDTTIIATALGQLIDEGKIDNEAKPFVNVAISRQLHPKICLDERRQLILNAIKRVVELA